MAKKPKAGEKVKADPDRVELLKVTREFFSEMAKNIHYAIIEECGLPNDPQNNAKAQAIILETLLFQRTPKAGK